MNRMLKIAVAGALALAAGLPVAHAQTNARADGIQAELDALKAQVATLERLQSKIAELENRLAKSEKSASVAGEDLEDLDDRVTKAEKHAVVDAIEFGGDFRFEAHSIDATVPAHFDGMALQKGLVDTLFYLNSTGTPPAAPGAVQQYIAQNYGAYRYFQDNLTFAQLRQAMAAFTPAQQQQLMGGLLPSTFVGEYADDNSILYTSRLRLQMHAAIGPNVTFDGRLGMYKVWGDSTGVQVFNGQPTSIGWDGTTVGVPNSDVLRVERGYFTWADIGGAPWYVSIGRRPSTDGAPLNFRHDEPRGGTPLGTLVDYQFDGVTIGWHLSDQSTLRFCYGLGFESQWGTGSTLTPGDKLKDAAFYGFNWDVWDTPEMFVQATVARAANVTDGFNGVVVLPNDPLSGNAIAAPVVLRYEPSTNVGDIDLASAVVIRHDGPFDWFVSGSWMKAKPEPVTTPFGGLLADPFDVPRDRTGTMWYAGARYNLPNGATRIGVEFNHGSQYWFNFALAEDDILGPKTSARGDVWEAYVTHRIRDRFVAKLDYIRYAYDYSGSGWLLGAPKKLDATSILGFPTYRKASKVAFSLTARF